ncbi:sensor histidine kinase [Labilithrix luteola]|uniref:sensor histidine kinase n=1 Tax=Labilithrix luteola TaxID=1391654 RepID=UPI0014761098|nr:HAMP domain-containing sensor histidine kinase [Labilithrix luteola]
MSPLSSVRQVHDPIAQESPDSDGAMHLRTHFLRRLAHDIASPTGVTLTVLEELATADRPRPELFAMARRSLKRLIRLSEHLALVAELENGTVEPELAATDLRALTKQALDDALSIDGRKDVVATCSLPGSPLVTAADPRLLLVVFREVIGNGLRLATSRVEVSVESTGKVVSIRVEDDGPGFSDDARESLGERFVRRSSQRGLGLSLSMGIQLVRTHGGTLSIETSRLPPGRRGTRGAAVVISLPSTSNDVTPAGDSA